MTKLNEEAFGWMREMILATLPQRATLYAPQYESDDGGGQVVGWELAETDVPCRLDALKQSADGWEVFGDALQNKPRYRAVFLHSTALAVNMRVVIDALSYRVLSSSDKHGAKLVVHTVLVAE